MLKLFILLIFFTSCSKNYTTSKSINSESLVEKKNAIVIFDVKFIDSFQDPESKLPRKIDSESFFFKDLKKQNKNTNILFQPLYYINNLQFLFDDVHQENKGRIISKFSDQLDSYQGLGIFEFSPAQYQLKKFLFNIKKFRNSKPNRRVKRWDSSKRWYQANFPEWKIESGKIYYIGSVTLFYETEKFSFGVLPRESLVKNIRLKRISFQDNFQKTKLKLFEKKWFPTEKVLNISIQQEWINKNGILKMVPLNYFDHQKEKDRPKKPKKRDKKKYFF